MKKLLLLTILLAMFAGMVMAQDEEFTYSITIKPTASIPSKIYDEKGKTANIYPFVVCYSMDKKSEKYIIYKGKISCLFVEKNYPADDYYVDFKQLISSEYIIDKSVPFQKRYNTINYVSSKMSDIVYLKTNEWNTLYNLIKNNGDKKKINQLKEIDQNRCNTLVRLLNEGSEYSNEILERVRLFNDCIEDRCFHSGDYIEKLDENISSTYSMTDKKANNTLYKIIELENIMRETIAAKDNMSAKEYNDFSSYLSKYRTPIDETVVSAMTKAIKERKQKLTPNQKEENYDITGRVIEILNEG